MMKLFWTPASPFVRKVMVTAYELKLIDRIEIVPTVWPHEWATRTVDFDPPFVAANPVGRIPALVTESGVALPESNLICRHLNSKIPGSTFIPSESDLDLPITRLWGLGDGALEGMILRRAETLRKPPERSEDFINKQRERIGRCFDSFDLSVLERPEITIAHVVAGVACGFMDFRYPSDNWREGRPGLSAWYETFSRRKSMKETMPGETPQTR